MTDSDHHSTDDDQWLTVAEIAHELRLNPATIRQWISRGQLPARRAGQRKLLVRRSDLGRMLARSKNQRGPGTREPSTIPGSIVRRPPPRSYRQLSTADIHGRQPAPAELERTITGIQRADKAWDRAQAASENPPPDPGFPRRLRALARAADEQSTWLLRAAQLDGFGWTPIAEQRRMTISHELRPGASRPGRGELWAEFDRAVERLGVAMEQALMHGVAWAYRDLAEVMHTIADELLGETPGSRESTQ